MNIDLIIQELRNRAEVFAGRVAGAAEFEAAFANSAGYTTPSAWVVPLSDDPEKKSQSSTLMNLTERFAVFVMIDSSADLRGQGAVSSVESLRNAIWAAILGWEIDKDSTPIEYEGGELVRLDRARLFWKFEFSLETTISEKMSREHADLVALPALTEVRVQIDMVDPAADPNTPPVTDPALGGYAGGNPGPDGRIEHEISITLPTN